MSRNSKNATRKAQAKQHSEMRKKGERGPSKTTPQHGKRWGYRSNPEVAKRLAEALKAAPSGNRRGTTAGKEILAKAGKAAS